MEGILATKLLTNNDLGKLKLSDTVIYSPTIAKPEIALGFHSFIHHAKDKMSITSKLQTKDKFYYVVNPYEHSINNYENSLKNRMRDYLSIKKEEPEILSRAFYKQWEMLLVFNLIDKKSMTYAALAEGPGSFLQALIHLRNKFYSTEKDKYYAVTIHSEDNKSLELAKNFLGYYNKKQEDLIKIHKTYPAQIAGGDAKKSHGDLTEIKTISLFKKEMKKDKRLADLVTADGGFEWDDENYQEQEAFALIIGEILAAITVQNEGGHFILKLFESFTKVTTKLLYIISFLYEEVYLYKPAFSRASNSEKYLVAKNFKYAQDDKGLKSIISTLTSVLEKFNTNNFIVDIFPELVVPDDFIVNIKVNNILIANQQQIFINKIVEYIKENNYFGDKYHSYRDEQIKATEKWASLFLIKDKKDVESLKGILSKMSV